MEELKKIVLNGTDAERKYVFSFTKEDKLEHIYAKFQLFTRYFYPKFFKSKDAPFHKEMVLYFIQLYTGKLYGDEFLDIGFRGCSKSTFAKLFIVFVLANDKEHSRRYFKVLSSDLQNSKQMVTDIYNMLIGNKIKAIYPELFEKSEMKRQETMDIIDFATGVKVTAGTVGQNQRGNVQGFEEATRPDFIVFDDIETRDSLRSATKTRAIWDRMQEAVDGLAQGGCTLFLANYISERGNVHRLVQRVKHKMIIPAVDKEGNPTWPEKFTKAQMAIIMGKSDDKEGEYLCEPSAGKDVLFSREEIDKQVPKTPIKENKGFKQFFEVPTSHRVAGGADVAGGLGLDSSTAVFIDFDVVPMQVVGTFHSNEIKPSEFAHELAREGRIFNECLLAPENNKFDETIGKLKDIYPMNRIYQTERPDKNIAYRNSTTFGWNTNSASKTKMFNDLVEAVENGWIELNDEDLIREARGYTRNDIMDREADVRMVTNHWDLITSCAIAYAMKDHAKRGSEPKYKNPIDDMWDRANAKETVGDLY
jgi:hypothetical protein